PRKQREQAAAERLLPLGADHRVEDVPLRPLLPLPLLIVPVGRLELDGISGARLHRLDRVDPQGELEAPDHHPIDRTIDPAPHAPRVAAGVESAGASALSEPASGSLVRLRAGRHRAHYPWPWTSSPSRSATPGRSAACSAGASCSSPRRWTTPIRARSPRPSPTCRPRPMRRSSSPRSTTPSPPR